MPVRRERRKFLAGMGAMAAATALSSVSCVAAPADTDIHIGYAAITWGGNDRQAIEDIATLGYHGIQLRSNCIQEFRDPAELRELLAKYGLKFVALSSGDFVELGQGQVNIPAVFDALREVGFRGWAIVELDDVTDRARTPRESAAINKKYLEEKLKITISSGRSS